MEITKLSDYLQFGCSVQSGYIGAVGIFDGGGRLANFARDLSRTTFSNCMTPDHKYSEQLPFLAGWDRNTGNHFYTGSDTYRYCKVTTPERLKVDDLISNISESRKSMSSLFAGQFQKLGIDPNDPNVRFAFNNGAYIDDSGAYYPQRLQVYSSAPLDYRQTYGRLEAISVMSKVLTSSGGVDANGDFVLSPTLKYFGQVDRKDTEVLKPFDIKIFGDGKVSKLEICHDAYVTDSDLLTSMQIHGLLLGMTALGHWPKTLGDINFMSACRQLNTNPKANIRMSNNKSIIPIDFLSELAEHYDTIPDLVLDEQMDVIYQKFVDRINLYKQFGTTPWAEQKEFHSLLRTRYGNDVASIKSKMFGLFSSDIDFKGRYSDRQLQKIGFDTTPVKLSRSTKKYSQNAENRARIIKYMNEYYACELEPQRDPRYYPQLTSFSARHNTAEVFFPGHNRQLRLDIGERQLDEDRISGIIGGFLFG